MKTRTYLRVGILFLVAVVIIFWGINYLKGRDLLSFEKHFFSRYERIGGLARSSPVTIHGFQVGQVRDIELVPHHDQPILVKFAINNRSIRIPRGTEARIYSTDLMGTKGIELDFADAQEYYSDRDTLTGTIEADLKDQVNTQILPLKLKAEELMASMDSALMAISLVFDKENRNNLATSFISVTRTLKHLEQTSSYLNEFIRDESLGVSRILFNLDSITLALMGGTSELRGIIRNFGRITDTLANAPLEESFRSMNDVLAGLHVTLSELKEGRGSLGRLIYSDSLYNALLATNASLNRLIEDVRINPGRYVSLSMTDRRRTYLNVSESDLARAISAGAGQTYYLCVVSRSLGPGTDEPVPPSVAGLDDIRIGNQVYYYTFKSQKVEACIRRLDKERKEWPAADIFTWVGGVWTRLDF